MATVSIVVPVFNEAPSLLELVGALRAVEAHVDDIAELIFVDDGSTDGSVAVLEELVRTDERVRIISLARNFGQTAALSAGFDASTGDIVVTLDADLQNDPWDIPQLLAKLDEGYDVVSGWRKDRKDERFRRNLVSRIANRLISRVSGVNLHDYGCTLKAYRREFIGDLQLYGEMHRFIPIYASWAGARITEIPVRHHARKYGTSNYGLDRTMKVILDLLVVRFLDHYLTRPIHVFGTIGLGALGLSGIGLALMVWLRVLRDVPMISTPLPTLTAVVGLVGVLSILLGLVAELIVRTYFPALGRQPYLVRKVL